MVRKTLFFLVILSSINLAGCKTSGDLASGRANREDNLRIQTIANPTLEAERVANKDATGLYDRLSMAEGELETLKVTSSAEKEVLQKKIEELEKQNQLLQDELTKNKNPLSTPASEAALASGKSEAEVLWGIALAQHKAGEHEKVVTTLDGLLQTQSKFKNHLQATLLLALTQYKLKSYNDAAITFNLIIDKYPKRREAALAWFGQGCAFMKLGQKDSAQLIFGELTKRYPKASESRTAQKISSRKQKTPTDLFALTHRYQSLSGM